MNTFPSLQVCIICLDTDNKLRSISDSLGNAYHYLIGQSLCDGEEIRRYLCGECVYTLGNFSRFRDKSLRALSVMEDLAGYYSVVTLEHIKLIDRQTCQLTSRLTRTATKQDHCDLYIKHSDKNDAQTKLDITDGLVMIVKNEYSYNEDMNKLSQYRDITDGDELTNICKPTECETEQNYEDNVNIKSELIGNEEIDFGATDNNEDSFVGHSHTLDLEKQNDGLINIDKPTECETEQSDENNVNIKSEICEICGNDEIDFESTDIFCVDHTLDLKKQNDGLINIDKPTECETEKNDENNVNIKSEICGNDEIDFESTDNFCVDHTSDLKKQNDGLINIDKPTECETEKNDENNVNIKSEICGNDEIDFESTDNFCEDHTLDLEKQNDGLINNDKETECDTERNNKNKVNIKSEVISENDDIHFELTNNNYKFSADCTLIVGKENIFNKTKKEILSKTRKKLQDKLVFETKDTLIGEELKKSRKIPHRKLNVNKLESEKVNCEENTKICEKSSNFKRHPKKKPSVSSQLKYDDQNNLLIEHKQKPDIKPYSCRTCGFKCKLKISLSVHKKTHKGETKFTCTLCDYTCKNKSLLKIHMSKHTDQKPFKCEMCPSTFKFKSNLSRHMKEHTCENPFKCDICDYTTVRKERFLHTRTHTVHLKTHSQNDSLKNHILTHRHEKTYACEFCDYIGSDLKRHIRIHTGERPYACTSCDRSFSKSCNLATHIRTHTGEKPFSCNICHYKCTRTSQLMRHLRTHTGEKPFSCDLCDFKCTRHCNLLQHTRKHTGQMLSCHYCSYRTTLKSSLVVHINRHMEIIKGGKTRKARAGKSVAS